MRAILNFGGKLPMAGFENGHLGSTLRPSAPGAAGGVRPARRLEHSLAAVLLVPLVALVAAACSYDYSVHENPTSDAGCQRDQDCPQGQHCVAGSCIAADGSVDVPVARQPEITATPTSLDFGTPILHQADSLDLVLSNVGDADLTVTALTVEESDSLQEVTADPSGTFSPARVLAPSETLRVTVTLLPEDALADSGQIRIQSDDPVHPELLVPFTSRQEGDPILEACVLDDATSQPEPFVDCQTNPVTDAPLIDFGVVEFQQDASKLVVAQNAGDGNAPLEVSDVHVTNDTGQAGHFAVELFILQPGPGGDATEIPVQLPAVLSASATGMGLEADELYVRLWFDADMDGFLPEESLVFVTNDATGQLAIPILGRVSGCPTGTWDLNGDPNDGCEYLCSYSGIEVCDGVDNNCDGVTDEEDAAGCTVYYRDVDNDTYGDPADARCLCAPDTLTHHTATRAGDCDDSKFMVNPGMPEQCGTSDDDDCDGDTNDPAALGCSLFFRDHDQDGAGVASDSLCLCVAEGEYTATTGGDCDDGNAQAHPGATEDCQTAFDDDCNGNTNDEDALHCQDHYVDLDGDGYGQTFLSKCLCQPEGSYSATLPNDCNDNSGLVHPGIPENCNTGFDDNCNQEINEQDALNCTTYYLDVDGDGYGVATDAECLCAPLGNYRALMAGDCDDQNSSVSPIAQETCATSGDDNCDGDSNDLNAVGCSVYYLDGDGDGYGVAGNVECRCQAQGSYRAQVSGDCDDANAQVSPGAAETCDTAFDDNCNGLTNDLNAIHCTNYYWDLDNDGYGVAGSVECRCLPNGNHRAVQPGDCADGDPGVNPGVPEVCDYIDNNCLSGIDEGFNLLSDPANCGACGNLCSNQHGTTTCNNGACDPTCDSGYGDCNGQPVDGCESDLGAVTVCGTCSQDPDCPHGFFCDGGLCRVARAPGTPCARDAQCTSGFCADGVCCDAACGGTCEACDLSGTVGACTPRPAGTDPEGECASTAAATCAENGFCDGAGACALWPAGTVCNDPTCSGSVLYVTDTCDGSGFCTDMGTQDCSPFQCSGTACLVSCTNDAQCVAGYYCSGGSCVAKKAAGQACASAAECLTGNCADAVCCDTPCSGVCRACNLAASMGTCADRPGGTDPEAECPTCQWCNGSGACIAALSGTDVKSDCAATPQSGCKADGSCDGAGACQQWASGTECQAQLCSGHTKYLADNCDGSGTCVDGGTVDCTPYICDGAGLDCRNSCTVDGDCVATSYCQSNVCVGKKGLGQTCGGAAECDSGYCTDGVCCDATCGATCQACDLAGSVGLCSPVPANQDPAGECAGTCQSCNGAGACGDTVAGADPENECAASATDTCGLTGACGGAGACAYWPTGTECTQATCAAAVKQIADTCDGAGTCVDRGQTSCAPYQCNAAGTDCRFDCSTDGDCTAGNYCAAGACVAQKPNGQPCGAGNECVSTQCADGVCCNSGCVGPCQACNVAGSVGTCVSHAADTDPESGCGLCSACDGLGSCAMVAAGADPKGDCAQQSQGSCGLDGTCDGAGACRAWVNGTICQAESCVGSTHYRTDTCNGTGSCLDGGIEDCSPYACDVDNTCRTTCSLDSHCIAGSYCNAGACVGQKADGQTCGASNECLSGYCVDGVCCNSDCSGLCRACNIAGAVGTCTPYALGQDPAGECSTCRVCNGSGDCVSATAGTDPKSDCAASDVSTCGLDGACDGGGACRLWPAGAICVAQSCTGSTKSLADTCDGIGSCVDNGAASCDPYACSGDDCGASCVLHTDCAPGYYCTASNVCAAKIADGQACGSAPECNSGYCVDGVCCNTGCGATCQACNLPGSLGTCTNRPAGTDPEAECGLCKICSGAATCQNATDSSDPKSECTQDSQSSCGQDGACDGAGACGFWAAGTECVSQSCTNHVLSYADTCNGLGTCTDGGTQDCTPYECNGSACGTSCSTDTQCVAGYYCSGSTCVAKKSNGSTCSAANQCSSGYCVDGFCCNSDCTGVCRACNISGSEGTCTLHSAGTDPEANCGLCRVCDATGACTAAAAGTDPKAECSSEPASSCGLDGQCDGAGACRLWPSGIECVPASCSGSTAYPADTCNGTGTCIDSGSQACSPYVCGATACRSSCSVNADCVTGYHCSGSACVQDSVAGTPCTLDAECASTFCRDGYCCDGDCSGACRACNRPGSEGTCTLYGAGSDPENDCGLCRVCNASGACIFAGNGTDPKEDCTTDPQSSCGLDGSCDGAGTCRNYSSGTVCQVQSCTGSTRYLADTCNGSGTCIDGGSQSCSPYLCSGTDCATTCSVDGDCVTGYYCSAANTCQAKQATGTSCSSASQCQSGYCVDGYCCDGACSGVCRACNVAGSLGTCSYRPSGTDPDGECAICQVCNGSGVCTAAADGTDPKNECAPADVSTCGQDGACDGGGACGLWANGTVCTAQSCTGFTQERTDYCDGSGTCVDSGTQDCTPYVCGGSACLTSCTTDAQCVAGYYCSGTACVVKKANGTACGAGGQCQSGYCVDGVCCNGDCVGSCRSCAISGSEGTCTYHGANTDPDVECGLCQACNGAGACAPATSGTDPKGQCSQDAQATCGQDGQCDGASACRLWASGTVCNGVVCLGQVLQLADTCDGAGTCADGGTSGCSPYVCDGSGSACRTTCSLDTDCVTGYFCSAGACVATKPNGQTCGAATECQSGYCVDGYCCNGGCTGACQGCDVLGSEGTCANRPSGTDPDVECAACATCNGAGACAFAGAGTDPKDDCAQAAPSTCGQDGTCDGTGGCQYWISGTECQAESCTSSTHFLADTCNGLGTCSDGGTQSCSPYLCAGGTCGTSCTLDTDCVTGFSCINGYCVYCGNSIIETGEACDGANLGGQTCATQGYDYGDLACDAACALDTTACQTADCILLEDFETPPFAPTGWSVIQTNPRKTWVQSTLAHAGSYAAEVEYDDLLEAQDEVLLTHPVRCTGMTITFWMAASLYWAVTVPNYEVELWAVIGAWDAGAGDDVLIAATTIADNSPANPAFKWVQASYAVPASLNNQLIRFAWRYVGADGAAYYLDDVELVY